jgi:hypothetical protein
MIFDPQFQMRLNDMNARKFWGEVVKEKEPQSFLITALNELKLDEI